MHQINNYWRLRWRFVGFNCENFITVQYEVIDRFNYFSCHNLALLPCLIARSLLLTGFPISSMTKNPWRAIKWITNMYCCHQLPQPALLYITTWRPGTTISLQCLLLSSLLLFSKYEQHCCNFNTLFQLKSITQSNVKPLLHGSLFRANPSFGLDHPMFIVVYFRPSRTVSMIYRS